MHVCNYSRDFELRVLFLQVATECFCGDKINLAGTGEPYYGCYNERATRCAGNRDQICGGRNAVSVYRGK